MLKKGILFTFDVVIIIAITVFALLFFKPIAPHDAVKAFAEGQINIVIEDEVIDTEYYPIIEEDKVFIPVGVLKKYINNDVELSEEYNRLYIEIKKPEFKLETDKLDQRINDKVNLNILAKNIDGIHYIDIVGLEKFFGITINHIEDTNILVIDNLKDEIEEGVINKNTYLRPKKSSFSFNLDKLTKGDKLTVFEDEGKWLKVRTDEGYIGYVLKSKVDANKKTIDIDRKINSVREDWDNNQKINLVWDHISTYSPDLSETEAIEGLDVLSPTWFSIVSPNGYIINNGDIDYVEDAHDKGYKVWALINNGFDKDLTHELLLNEEGQENAIKQLLVYSSLYNLDGINIDFENVYYEDKDKLTEFVTKLTNALKEQNLIVSMDMTVPSSSPNWSKFYDREALGQILDYCMVMTYDEHWASSPRSGSVASIEWVKRGIEKTLEYIPEEKLLMGIPFYTREWEETKGDNGKTKVKSKALSMEVVKERIDENNSEIVWLEDIGQHYTEYNIDDKRYRIWIEDDKSIELKAKLVHKYNLAGAASWRKGFEEEDIWTVLNETVKGNKELVMKDK